MSPGGRRVGLGDPPLRLRAQREGAPSPRPVAPPAGRNFQLWYAERKSEPAWLNEPTRSPRPPSATGSAARPDVRWQRFSESWSLDAAFDHNFPSHLVGKLKPDADYFAHVVAAVGVPADRLLFVDDNAINVEAAARFGLHAQRVVGVDGARQALVELGLLDR